MSKINITQQLKDVLSDYTDEVMEAIIEALQEVAEDTADELKTAGDFQDRTGKYRKGWRVTTERHRTFANTAVHNKPRYNLTHLLEYGHATSNGGRTRAFPHIATINEEAQEKAIKKVMEVIEKIK